MPSYTTSLRLIQPATGEYSGSWGTQVNNGITALVDTSVAGTASITMTTSDYTLSTANGATDEARAMFLVLGGTPGAARNVICPAVSKLYYVTNNTTGGFAQTVKTASGTGISVPNGASMVLRCDGTNVVEAQNSLGNIVLNGGTANGVAYLNASKALTTGSGLVFDGTNFSTTGTATATKLIPTGGSATGNGMYLPAANTLAWSTNGAETMRLDSSGNLGLGVTPSAWTAYKALQIMGANGIYGFNPGDEFGYYQNAYYSSGWKYGTSSVAASRYAAYQGTHAWFTAPSGTAGTAISFTQAMTLDASGNLGVGITSPGVRLDVASASTTQLRVQMSGQADMRIVSDTGYGALSLESNMPLLFRTNATERARITSGGNLLIGLTSDSSYGALQVNAASNRFFEVGGSGSTRLRLSSFDAGYTLGYRFSQNNGTEIASIEAGGTATSGNSVTDNSIRFNNLGSERARITSGGDLLVGTTTAGAGAGFSTRLAIDAGAADAAIFKTSGGVSASPARCWNSATTGDNLFLLFATEGTYTGRGSIDYNRAGGLVRYNTTSDYRAKDIIGPVQNPGATIDALKVYEGRMKGASQSRPMLIAHEAQAVAPYAVSGIKDEVNEDGTPKFQQMDVSSLVPLLLAEIQSLRARVAALEQA